MSAENEKPRLVTSSPANEADEGGDRVKVAFMTGNDAEYAHRVIDSCWSLETLRAAYKRATALGQVERANAIGARMNRVRGS